MANKNMNELVINILGENYEKAYFIDGVLSNCKGVYDLDIFEITQGANKMLQVTITYDSTLLNDKTLLEYIDWAEQNYVGFFTELQQNEMTNYFNEYEYDIIDNN